MYPCRIRFLHLFAQVESVGGPEGATERANGATRTERVSELEALKAVTALDFLSDDVEDTVDELGTFSVVSLGPVVSGTTAR